MFRQHVITIHVTTSDDAVAADLKHAASAAADRLTEYDSDIHIIDTNIEEIQDEQQSIPTTASNA